MSNSAYNTDGLPRFRAGTGREKITPPVGTALAGYFHERISEAVRDDLFCNALVIEADGQRMALVSCDLISVPREIVDPAKEQIEQETGIPPESVMICATHTHTGPETRIGRVVTANEDYLRGLPGLIAGAVAQAADGMFDALLFPGRQEEPDLGTNRLARKKDGTEVFSQRAPDPGTIGPGRITDRARIFTAPDEIGPASGIDPEVLVLMVRDMEDQVRGVVVNYANHGDIIGGSTGNRISADWFGEIGKAIRSVYGDQAVTVFLTGACGDINHHYWRPTRQPISGPAKAMQVGRALAGVAMNAGEKGEPLETDESGAILRIADIPYYTRDEQMAREVARLREQEEIGEFDRFTVERFDQWPHDNEDAAVPLQVLRLGDLAFVGLPGEIFVDWGLEIKHWSPARHTFVCELANDWFGYVPTTDQAQRGAYGARPILSRRLDADGGRQMADNIQVMLYELWDDGSEQ